MTLTEFATKIIGTPFVDRSCSYSGIDCWRLIVLAYKECCGINLPDGIEYSCFEPERAREALISGTKKEWLSIQSGLEKTWDVICFRPCHVGLILGQGKMLHVRENGSVCIERYLSPLWKSIIFGIYRYEQLAS